MMTATNSRRRPRPAPPRGLPSLAYSSTTTTPSTPERVLFDQPNAPFPAMLDADQQALAGSMRAAWTTFAARGNPSSHVLRWPPFRTREKVLSLVPMHSTVETDFAAAHHCSFWAAG